MTPTTLSQKFSRIGCRWAMLLAIVFATTAGFEITARFQSATYNREVYPENNTPPLGGTEVLDYEFTAQHETLRGLWVFFYYPPNAPTKGRLDLTMRRPGEDRPFWTQTFACERSKMVFDVQLCRIEGLSLKKGERYVLRYAMPFMEAGRGWGLRYVTMDNTQSTIKWGSEVRQSAEPSMLWMEMKPHYPLAYMLVCALLLAICSMGAGKKTSLAAPALLIMTAGCILLAAYKWQFKIWNFWGTFWPDGPPALSHKLFAFFTGQIPFKECLAYFDDCRTGQAFFVPVVMAMFQVVGLSIKWSYFASNAFFFVAAIALLIGLLRLNAIKDDRRTIIVSLIFFSNACFIGSVGALQTDMAGVAATMFFAYSLLRAFAATDTRAGIGWYIVCGIAGFIACTIRIALLPLLLVSSCLFVWSAFFERQRTWLERLTYLLPTLIGGTLLWACWSLLNLWATLNKDWDFAQPFLKLFSWKGFAVTTLLGMQLSLPIIILLWRRLFYDRGFTAVVGSVCGLLALLAYGHIPPWLRYWSPPAVLGVILIIQALKVWPKKERTFLAAAWITAFINTVFLLKK
jgi:hypothetical protein